MNQTGTSPREWRGLQTVGGWNGRSEVYARLRGGDRVNCHYDPTVVTSDFINEIRTAGFEFHVWCIDDLPNALEAFRRGVQTVSTNCSQKLLNEHKAHGGR